MFTASAQLFCWTVPAKWCDRYKRGEKRKERPAAQFQTGYSWNLQSEKNTVFYPSVTGEITWQWSPGDLSLTSQEDNAAEMYTTLSQTILNPINWHRGKNTAGESHVNSNYEEAVVWHAAFPQTDRGRWLSEQEIIEQGLLVQTKNIPNGTH